ncbi:hypothetical protein ACVIGB_000647 [Bradyrhizobium sp. USDA 4341]
MDLRYRGAPVVFLDYEASGLFADSHPIEAGIASWDGVASAFLIAPHSSWGPHRWDYSAERIHGIPRVLLELEGIPCPEACNRLINLTAGHIVLSDNPEAERMWSEALFATVGLPAPFTIVSADEAIFEAVRELGFDEGEAFFVIRSFIKKFPSIHRAGPDAERLRALARSVLDRAFRDELFGKPDFAAGWEQRIGEIV